MNMKDKKHNTLEGFLRILDLGYFTHSTSKRNMDGKNRILSRTRSKFGILPNFQKIKIEIDKIKPTVSFSTEFILGLIDGDGSINFSFRNDSRRVRANFSITQGIDDYHVLVKVKSYFNRGQIQILKSEGRRFQIQDVRILLLQRR